MDVRIAAIVFTLGWPLNGQAQQDKTSAVLPSQDQPEEILITGKREMLKQMWQAEKTAYDTFNLFNDEKRFDISCSINKPTGTHFEKQVCQPNFQIEATRGHGQDYLASLCDLLCPGNLPGSSQVQNIPTEALIASQLQAYRQKLKQVAEQHPEFLQAIIQYGKMRERYEKQP